MSDNEKGDASFLDMEKLERIGKKVDSWPDWKKEGWAVLDREVLKSMTTDTREGETKLLPCPMCGNPEPKMHSNGIGDFYVVCEAEDEWEMSCGLRSSDRRCETEKAAISRWNTRQSSQLAQLTERAERAEAEVERLGNIVQGWEQVGERQNRLLVEAGRFSMKLAEALECSTDRDEILSRAQSLRPRLDAAERVLNGATEIHFEGWHNVVWIDRGVINARRGRAIDDWEEKSGFDTITEAAAFVFEQSEGKE